MYRVLLGPPAHSNESIFQKEFSELHISEMRLLLTRSLWPYVDLENLATVFVLLALLQIDFDVFLAVRDHRLCVRIKSMTTLLLIVKERVSHIPLENHLILP